MNFKNQTFRNIMIILGVLLLAALVVLWQVSHKPKRTKIMTPMENSISVNTEQALAKLYTSSKLTPPSVATNLQVIAQTKLPTELLPLINAKASNLLIDQAKFPINRRGYKIQYQLTNTLYQATQTFAHSATQNHWHLALAVNTTAAGLLKLQSRTYDIVVEETVIDSNNIKINISIIPAI